MPFCSPLCSVNAGRVKLCCRGFVVENDHEIESTGDCGLCLSFFRYRLSGWNAGGAKTYRVRREKKPGSMI